MANDEPDQEQGSDTPSLEPPKLFSRRKRKPKPRRPRRPRARAAAPSRARACAARPEPEPEPAPPEPEPEPEPVAVEPAPVDVAPVEEPRTEPVETPRSSAPQEPPVPLVDPVVEEEPTAVYDATDPTTDVATAASATSVATAPPAVTHEVADGDEPAATGGTKKVRTKKVRTPREDREPVASPRNGAVVTGVVAGLMMLGLVFLGFEGCEAARGSNSCGTAPGLLLLVLVLTLTVIASGLLLRYFRVPDPVSTAFLAVGLVGVVSLLFLVEVLDTWPMLVVIPVLSAVAFLASWWITTTYVEPTT